MERKKTILAQMSTETGRAETNKCQKVVAVVLMYERREEREHTHKVCVWFDVNAADYTVMLVLKWSKT